MLRWTRRLVQGSSLFLFILLLIVTRYNGNDEIGYPVRFFLDLDPLILLGTLLSSHALPVAFFAAIAVFALTFLFGRAFCGWVCPMGASNQLIGRWLTRSAAGQRAVRKYVPGQGAKYGVLVGLLLASVLGLQWIGIVDPISLMIRSVSLALGPVAEISTRAFFDSLYRTDIEAVRTISEPAYRLAKNLLLSFEQPAYRQAELIGFIILGVFALNLLRPRFFCRFVCPLGALLSLPARYSTLRLRESGECNRCKKCATRCPAGADPDRIGEGRWRPAECYICGNCTSLCDKGLGFRFELPTIRREREPVAGIDAGRRNLISGLAVGLVAAPLVRIPHVKASPNPKLIRPPGSRPEPNFLDRCVRCGECMKVCVTGGLQPAAFEAGLEGLWTPILVPRMGYCEYNCTLCGQVCPTGAIRELKIKSKKRVRIGTAFVDPGRCLPLALGVECVVCEEHCPVSPKAIKMVAIDSFRPDGSRTVVHRPLVDPNRCIGCGICEARCPIKGLAAIRVNAVGESRNPDNQLLLESVNSGYG